MDWLAEQWPWIAAVLSIVAKFAQDHLRIAQHAQRIGDLEDGVRQQQINQAEQGKDIKHIRDTVDALASRQGISENDIKEIIKNRE